MSASPKCVGATTELLAQLERKTPELGTDEDPTSDKSDTPEILAKPLPMALSTSDDTDKEDSLPPSVSPRGTTATTADQELVYNDESHVSNFNDTTLDTPTTKIIIASSESAPPPPIDLTDQPSFPSVIIRSESNGLSNQSPSQLSVSTERGESNSSNASSAREVSAATTAVTAKDNEFNDITIVIKVARAAASDVPPLQLNPQNSETPGAVTAALSPVSPISPRYLNIRSDSTMQFDDKALAELKEIVGDEDRPFDIKYIIAYSLCHFVEGAITSTPAAMYGFLRTEVGISDEQLSLILAFWGVGGVIATFTGPFVVEKLPNHSHSVFAGVQFVMAIPYILMPFVTNWVVILFFTMLWNYGIVYCILSTNTYAFRLNANTGPQFLMGLSVIRFLSAALTTLILDGSDVLFGTFAYGFFVMAFVSAVSGVGLLLTKTPSHDHLVQTITNIQKGAMQELHDLKREAGKDPDNIDSIEKRAMEAIARIDNLASMGTMLYTVRSGDESTEIHCTTNGLVSISGVTAREFELAEKESGFFEMAEEFQTTCQELEQRIHQVRSLQQASKRSQNREKESKESQRMNVMQKLNKLANSNKPPTLNQRTSSHLASSAFATPCLSRRSSILMPMPTAPFKLATPGFMGGVANVEMIEEEIQLDDGMPGLASFQDKPISLMDQIKTEEIKDRWIAFTVALGGIAIMGYWVVVCTPPFYIIAYVTEQLKLSNAIGGYLMSVFYFSQMCCCCAGTFVLFKYLSGAQIIIFGYAFLLIGGIILFTVTGDAAKWALFVSYACLGFANGAFESPINQILASITPITGFISGILIFCGYIGMISSAYTVGTLMARISPDMFRYFELITILMYGVALAAFIAIQKYVHKLYDDENAEQTPINTVS